MVSEQVVQFLDEGLQAETTFNTKTDKHDFDGDTEMDSSLGSWLSRPLEIANITWNSGSSPTGTFDPWTLFMTDPRNVNKIAYYRNFRCKHLCLKFLINGGPFTYGRMLFSYLPLDPAGAVTQYADRLSFEAGAVPFGPVSAVSHTHRPFIIVDPTRSQGGCFELPFIWPFNWVNIPAEEWSKLGNISYIALTPLSNCGGAAAMNVSIKVFAWLVDPVFSAPTVNLPSLPAQSSAGDEYVGMVSKRASALANMAGTMTGIPAIGGYARATQLGATAVAGISSMLGLSRPAILTPNVPMRPTFVSELAVLDRPDYVMKLTTDSKQELSISPAIMGLGEADELNIATIAARETYIGQFAWAVSAAEGAVLASMPVTPLQYATYTPAGYTVLYQTLLSACGFTSLPFKYWRGNMKFRFQIVASQFHRGRVKVVYDPDTAPISTKTNATYSRIVDIQETSDFTITIGWNSLKGMLLVPVLTSTSTLRSNTISYTPFREYDNGSLTMFVENELMIPIPGASADIKILVWASLEDAVYNFPIPDTIANITPSPPFVASTGLEPPLQNFTVGDMTQVSDLNNVYFGETIVSFRSLMKRYSQYVYSTFVGASATLPSFCYYTIRSVPLLPGSDATGLNLTSTLKVTNFITLSHLSYISTAFSCFRGSIRYKFQVVTDAAAGPTAQVQLATDIGCSNPAVSTIAAAYTNDQVSAGNIQKNRASTIGIATIDTTRNPFLETEVPFWSNYKFKNPKAFASNAAGLRCEGLSVVFPQITSTGRTSVQSYVAVGDDYTLGFYTGPPAYWSNAYNVY